MRTASALLAATLFTVLLLEVSVRILGLAPALAEAYGQNVPDENIPYRRKPNSVLRGRWHTDEFDFELRHNSLGFRDGEHSREKPPGTWRVLFIGDSFTYGVGASYEDTIPSVAEQLLADEVGNSARIEAIRMGLPRYFPAAEALVLEHYGLAFEPDVVVVGVLANDVIDTHYGMGAVQVDREGSLRSREGAYMGALGRWLYLHSHAARIVLRRASDELRARRDPVSWPDVSREGGRHEDDWEQMERDLLRIRELTMGAGAEMVLLPIPQRGAWAEKDRYVERRLSDWARRHGVPFVPTVDAMKEAGGDELYWKIDGHCNDKGYAVLAETLVARLASLGILPSR